MSVGDRFGIKGKPDPSARLLSEGPFRTTLHSHQPFKPGGVIFPPEIVTRARRERVGLGSGLQISRLFAVGGGISLSQPVGGWVVGRHADDNRKPLRVEDKRHETWDDITF